MNKNILSNTKTTLSCILVLVFTNSLLCLTPVQAQQSQQTPTLVEKIKLFFFGSSPGGVATGRSKGGAVRGRCSNSDRHIIALVPSTKEGVPFVEQTVSERPTFWFYVPYSGLDAEFVLLNSQGKEVYSKIFLLNQQSGIIDLQLPKTIPPLQQGNEYGWVFSAICNPQDRAADEIVNGSLKRIPVSSTLNNQLKTASARNRVSAYTEANLWYETLTTLAELRHNEPQNSQIKADWANVLQLVGLPSNVPQNWATYSLSSYNENSTSN